MDKSKRMKAWLLVIALVIVSVFRMEDMTVSAADADVKLAKKSVSLMMQKSKSGTKYGTVKVKVKVGKGVTVKKVSCKVKKKGIVTVAAKGKTAPTLTVKAKKQGSTQVAVSVRYKKAGKIKTKKLTLKVKVTIKEGVSEGKATSTPTVKPTQSPSVPADWDETRSPGIYNSKTGKLEKTWSEALSENMITMDANGMITSSSGVSSYSGEWIDDIDLVLSNEVKGIKEGAFGTQIECGLYLDKISVPASVHIIEKGAFGYFSFSDYGVEEEKVIKVDSGNPIYDSRNNCNAIIKTDTNELVIGCSRTVIPEDVTAIWDFAFSGCSDLKSIVIPNTVTSIGDLAFAGCTGLTSIHIPDRVTYIGNDAFPESLISITVGSGNSIYDSRDNCNAIIDTVSNELIVGCQNTIIPNSVKSIGDNAFEGCYSLVSITVPESVVSIGDRAFSACNGMVSITVSANITSIGEGTFWNCNSLKNITIPDSVTSIGDNAFAECCSLTSIVIPDSVTSIGDYAFENCSSLMSIVISNSVTSIGKEAFSGCNTLGDIMVDSKNSKYDSRENCNAIIETATNRLIKGGSKTVIPNGVTSIGDRAFEYCDGLTGITVPSSVTSIGNHAFSNCNSLTSITIPDSVISIGDYAFYSCENLVNANIFLSYLEIGERAFADCSNLVITLERGKDDSWGYEYVSNAFDNIKELVDNRDIDEDEDD